MGKTYIYTGKIDRDARDDIQRFVDWIDENAHNGPLNVYLDSDGGQTSMAEVLSDILNSYKSKIVLIGNGMVSSCAFDVFYQFKGKKTILKGTKSIVHVSNSSYHAVDLIDKQSTPFKDFEYIKSSNLEYANAMGEFLNLSKGELDIMKRGGDILLLDRELDASFMAHENYFSTLR